MYSLPQRLINRIIRRLDIYSRYWGAKTSVNGLSGLKKYRILNGQLNEGKLGSYPRLELNVVLELSPPSKQFDEPRQAHSNLYTFFHSTRFF